MQFIIVLFSILTMSHSFAGTKIHFSENGEFASAVMDEEDAKSFYNNLAVSKDINNSKNYNSELLGIFCSMKLCSVFFNLSSSSKDLVTSLEDGHLSVELGGKTALDLGNDLAGKKNSFTFESAYDAFFFEVYSYEIDLNEYKTNLTIYFNK